MIPKIIHYTWFGGNEKPIKVKNQIAEWKRKLPDYQFIEWSEGNYDLNATNTRYVQQAYESNMWAFVTDYVRLDVLNRYGGIYLDTDVKVIKSFDSLLEQKSFIGKESEFTLCTAVIGAESNSGWLKTLLKKYEERSFRSQSGNLDKLPNSKYLLHFFGVNSSSQIDDFSICKGVKIYPAEFFSPLNFANGEKRVTKNTYAIHYYSGTWKSKGSKIKDQVVRVVTHFIGEQKVNRIKKYFNK